MVPLRVRLDFSSRFQLRGDRGNLDGPPMRFALDVASGYTGVCPDELEQFHSIFLISIRHQIIHQQPHILFRTIYETDCPENLKYINRVSTFADGKQDRQSRHILSQPSRPMA